MAVAVPRLEPMRCVRTGPVLGHPPGSVPAVGRAERPAAYLAVTVAWRAVPADPSVVGSVVEAPAVATVVRVAGVGPAQAREVRPGHRRCPCAVPLIADAGRLLHSIGQHVVVHSRN